MSQWSWFHKQWMFSERINLLSERHAGISFQPLKLLLLGFVHLLGFNIGSLCYLTWALEDSTSTLGPSSLDDKEACSGIGMGVGKWEQSLGTIQCCGEGKLLVLAFSLPDCEFSRVAQACPMFPSLVLNGSHSHICPSKLLLFHKY